MFNTNKEEKDILYEDAKRLVIESKRASASLFERRLRIGFAQAYELIEMLEAKKVIGPCNGAKPRKVLIKKK